MMDQIKNPPGEIVKRVMQMLEERKIYIPPESIDAVLAMMCHWLENENRGHEYMAYLLNLDSAGGQHQKVYTLQNSLNRLTGEVHPEKIVFLRGCLVDGTPTPVSLIKIEDRESVYCGNCGSAVVCTDENPDDPFSTLCSYCAGHDENLRSKVETLVSCEKCTHAECNWHPSNVDMPPFDMVQ